MDNVTDIRTMAEARLHRGVRPSGLIRRDGTRLEPGEIQEIQVTAERGGQVRPDQVLGMIEVIEALSRRAYARFQQVADAREELAAERLKVEDLQAQGAIQAAEHKMYVDRVAELDVRLSEMAGSFARANEDVRLAADRIEELEGQLAQRRYTDEALRAQVTELEGHLSRLSQERDEAIREMGRARSEYTTASRIATENGEALAEETENREAAEQIVAKIRAIVWATEGLDKVIERRGELDSEPAQSLVAVVSRVRAVIGQ